jgi:transposase, IS30 family
MAGPATSPHGLLEIRCQIRTGTGPAVYFCDPHSPWQRGSHENTNELPRQYYPNGTNLPVHSKDHLDAVAAQPNSRPRKTPGRKTPAQALDEFPAAAA